MCYKKKKVLHIITGLNDGGAEGVLTRLCIETTEIESVVISLTDDGKYASVLRGAGIKVVSLNMSFGLTGVLSFTKLIHLIKRESPDVIQTWMYHADLLGGVAGKIAGVRKIFWGIRHSTFDPSSSKKSIILVAHLCAFISKIVPTKIICCAHNALLVHKEMGYDKSKLLVVHNGFDLNKFNSNSVRGLNFRTRICNEKTFLLGMVGRYDPQKDHLNLLKALEIIISVYPDVCCVLVGSNLDSTNMALLEKIRSYNLIKNVKLLGQQTDVPAVMNGLDLHVLSSAFGEGFPNVVAEAMACSTPCVSTNVGDALEIIGDPDLCVPVRDEGALAKVIISLIKQWTESPEGWLSRKDSCSERISKEYSLKKMADEYRGYWFG